MSRTIHTLALLSSAFLNADGSATLPDGSTMTPDGVPANDATFGDDDLMGLGDDEFGEELGDDEIAAIVEQVEAGVEIGFGAEKGKQAGKRVRNRLKRVQGRGKRQASRNQELQNKLRAKLPPEPTRHGKEIPGVLGSSVAVTVAGPYSVAIVTEAPFMADELFIDGPAGTYVTSIMFGESPVMPAGVNEVAIAVFGPTAQGRQLVHGKRLGVGQRLTVTFTTTATTGKINVALIGDKSPTC